MQYSRYFLYSGKRDLSDYETNFTEQYTSKSDTQEEFQNEITKLRKLQSKLYAQGKYGVLVILQAMDAAGKDVVIKHVMSGVNPQACKVSSFQAPSDEELSHDFMWRCMKKLPSRGHIGIFNRSYYEEVLIAKVHPELLAKQNLPFYHEKLHLDQEFWDNRYKDMVNIEKYLMHNGYLIIKFFLNVSREEQKNRFLSRIDNEIKNWKFTMSDIKDRYYWDEFQEAYQELLRKTTHPNAGWYVIPADNKWYMRLVISKIIVEKLQKLNLRYPEVNGKHKEDIIKGREVLMNEEEYRDLFRP
jgi:PPK2 family polyphosphate:nucleotide phosphotransferase